MNALLALELGNSISIGTAVWAGLVGALAMLMVIYGGRAMGMTSMDLLRMLGAMVTPNATGGTAYGIGMMMHLMMGAVLGVVHAAVLVGIGPSSAGAAFGVSLIAGVLHGMMVVVAMPNMLNLMHPLVKNGSMPAPGTAMTNYGKMTPMGVTMAHVAFAVVTGLIYVAGAG